MKWAVFLEYIIMHANVPFKAISISVTPFMGGLEWSFDNEVHSVTCLKWVKTSFKVFTIGEVRLSCHIGIAEVQPTGVEISPSQRKNEGMTDEFQSVKEHSWSKHWFQKFN